MRPSLAYSARFCCKPDIIFICRAAYQAYDVHRRSVLGDRSAGAVPVAVKCAGNFYLVPYGVGSGRAAGSCSFGYDIGCGNKAVLPGPVFNVVPLGTVGRLKLVADADLLSI